MTNEEKAALRAAGERALAFYEKGMDEALQNQNSPFAWGYQCKYDGAAYMLKELGLLSFEEYSACSGAVFTHYMDTAYPGSRPKEEL